MNEFDKEIIARLSSIEDHLSALELPNVRLGPNPKQVEELKADCERAVKEILDSMSFDEQNAAMRDHMVTAHPNWLTPEQLRVHDLLPEEERRTQERIAAVVRERDERIAALEAQLTAITAERDALLCSGAAANTALTVAQEQEDVIAEEGE